MRGYLQLYIGRGLRRVALFRRFSAVSRVLISDRLLRDLNVRRITTRVILVRRLVDTALSAGLLGAGAEIPYLVRGATDNCVFRFHTRRDEAFAQFRIRGLGSGVVLPIGVRTRSVFGVDDDYRGVSLLLLIYVFHTRGCGFFFVWAVTVVSRRFAAFTRRECSVVQGARLGAAR